jgi:multiple sugar transport system permease protein
MTSTATRPVALTVAKADCPPAPQAHVPARTRRSRRVDATPYLLLAPSLLLIVVWAYYPLFDTIRISVFDGTLLSGPQRFVGLNNYAAVISTPEFQKALGNTFKYIAGMIPLAVILPMGVALLAADIRGRMRDVYRSIIFAVPL